METITVEVWIPATGNIHDFALPAAVPLRDVVQGMIDILEQAEQNMAFDRDTPLLCDMTQSRALDQSRTLAQEGIRDGMRLMLL